MKLLQIRVTRLGYSIPFWPQLGSRISYPNTSDQCDQIGRFDTIRPHLGALRSYLSTLDQCDQIASIENRPGSEQELKRLPKSFSYFQRDTVNLRAFRCSSTQKLKHCNRFQRFWPIRKKLKVAQSGHADFDAF